MAIFSSLASIRKASRSSEVTEPMITFRLRDYWFALPMTSVQKVIFLDKIYGDPQGTGISLTRYHEQEILVIDVGYKIFGEPQHNPDNSDSLLVTGQRYLAILQYSTDNLVGLPIDSSPAIQRVTKSAFTTIPDAYLAAGNIRCISSSMIQLPDLPPIFLLNPELLQENWLKR